MTRIFISYRRDDSDGHTGRLFDHLQNHFLSEDIFIDFQAIEPGAAFPDRILHALQSCEVALIIIGKRWLTVSNPNGQRRLDDLNDFVRLEITHAFQRKVLVIPVLVGGATMPSPDALPSALSKLALIQAHSISNDTFKQDVEKLSTILRKALGNNFSLPMLEWCSVPVGTVEIEGKRYEVNDFRMSKYPITYGQYEVFVENRGYTNKDFWSLRGWQWKNDRKQPKHYWNDRLWHVGDRPVIGITWCEAIAFCRWLSVKMGLSVRLPTEWEWQRAAQGDDKRLYPWGNTFYSTYCNTSEGNFRGTTRVQQFPDGISPFGLYDMAGNVAEWCLNDYDVPDRIMLESSESKVVKGGSWRFSADKATIVSRSKQIPEAQAFFLGFRIVVSET